MQRIAIVGLGMIGGSLGLALRRARPGIDLLGIVRQGRDVDAALRRGVVSRASTDLKDATQCELVVIATPLGEVSHVLTELARASGSESAAPLVTDVCSVKLPVVEWARQLLPDPDRFMGGHPMAGKTASGIGAADENLFFGAPWVLTPVEGQDQRPFAAFVDLVRAIGAHPLIVDAAEHDRRAALISHLAFVISSAYSLTIVGSHDPAGAVAIAGPGFRDMVRLARGNPGMYAEIGRTNRAYLLDAIDQFQNTLQEYRRCLGADDAESYRLFSAAQDAANGWTR